MEDLSSVPAYAAWPLAAMLRDRAAFRAFLQTAWETYVAGKGRHETREGRPDYGKVFDDRRLQARVGALVAGGDLETISAGAQDLPPWACAGLRHDPARNRRVHLPQHWMRSYSPRPRPPVA
jgi:hypothetical protein